MKQELRAVIYTRVSSDAQAEEGTSLETQELACLRKAAEMGAQVVEICSDPGVSGALYLARPGIQKALSHVDAGRVNLLIAMKLDRAGRGVDPLRSIKRRVEQAGARLLFADGVNFERNAIGNLIFNQLAGFAEYERDVIRERTMSGRRKRAEAGIQPYRNLSPFGYHIVTYEDVLTGRYPPGTAGTYQVVPEEASHVQEVFRRCAAGSSLRAIALWLEEQGVPTRQGGRFWRANSIRLLLKNPTYRGLALLGRMEVVPDEARVERGLKLTYFLRERPEVECIAIPVPPIVDEATWNACQERLQENKQRIGGNPGRRHLLTGLLRCSLCGNRMNAIRTRGVTYYRCKPDSRCKGCGNHRGERLETAVLGAVIRVARQPELVEAALSAYAERPSTQRPADTPDAIQAELKKLADEETAAVRAQVAGIQAGASPEAYDTLFHDIRARRGALEKRLARAQMQHQPLVASPKTVAEKIARAVADVETVLAAEELTPAEKNAVLSRVVRAIHPNGEGYQIDLAPLPGTDETVQQVWPYERHTSPDLAAALWYLDDTDVGAAATEVIPGSHRQGEWKHDSENIIPNADVEAFGVAPVPLSVRAGSVAIIHVQVVHRATANTSTQNRSAIINEYKTYEALDRWGNRCAYAQLPLLRNGVPI